MTTVALMAAGTHGLSLSAPALADQAKQKEAASEHAVIPHGPTAASDGVPAPILAGGVVLAFAVGLSGGIAHRRRRVARRATWPAAAAPPPVREVSEPVQPAPPPPEPETPAPRVVSPPLEAERPKPPAPPPPETPAPRVVATPPTPVPPPPEPPRREAPARPSHPLRLVPRAPAPRPAVAADASLAEAPEIPRLQPEAVAPEPIMPPLTEAPEALQVPPSAEASEPQVVPSAEAPEPQLPPAGPARRFARVAHWPEEATELWTCEIDWKAGYRKANFRAMIAAPGEPKRRPFGESPAVRWALMGEPEPPTPELAVRVRALVETLEAAGWEHIGRGRRWYEQRFLWRGDGDPQPIVVSGLAAED